MKLGFLILAHDRPDQVRRLCATLAAGGDRVVVHYDAAAAAADREAVARIAAEHAGQVRVISKVRCRWGEWSLVEAVLHALREFAAMADPPDHIHLMSAAECPLRPLADLREFLRRHPDRDFIECKDIGRGEWVKGGLGIERFRFHFPFNYRSSRKAFDRLVWLQRKLRIRRKMPCGLRPHMGSQWWTMRWSTCEALLAFIDANPRVTRYFRSTWIPDESFVQTLVAKLVPRAEIADLQLTFHHLTPTGRPYVFHDDHLGLLRRIPHFFARKVSAAAGVVWSEPWTDPSRTRRIPSPRHLALVRDLLRSRIDNNYIISRPVPGHSPDPAPLDAAGLAARPPFRGTRPFVLCLLGETALAGEVRAAVSAQDNCLWLGRPFAPAAVDSPAAVLDPMGASPAAWRLRDAFPADFVRQLLDACPAGLLPVGVVCLGEDRLDISVLEPMDGLLPLLVTRDRPSAWTVSRVAGVLQRQSPLAAGRMVAVCLADLPRELACAGVSPFHP